MTSLLCKSDVIMLCHNSYSEFNGIKTISRMHYLCMDVIENLSLQITIASSLGMPCDVK